MQNKSLTQHHSNSNLKHITNNSNSRHKLCSNYEHKSSPGSLPQNFYQSKLPRLKLYYNKNKMFSNNHSTLFLAFILTSLLLCHVSLLAASSPVPSNSNMDSGYVNENSTITVHTSSAILKGSIHLTSAYNDSVIKFLSVPYAQAPIDKLRFQKPLELNTKNSTILDVTKFGKTCPQYRHLVQFISPLLNLDHEHQISEDCLHLHIYVPNSVGTINKDEENKLQVTKQVPVIVFIPGEGYHFADARQFDGSHLAQKTQSIVVVVQYRVGVLGFLQAPEFGIEGNMGLYDQLMALKWVHKNIKEFGGDSSRVTVMGRFSGAMSISTMITAPNFKLLQHENKPLFTQVALISGIAVEDWTIDNNPELGLKQIERQICEKLNQCSKPLNSSWLYQVDIHTLLKISNYGWRPVIDNELVGKQSPIQAVQNNHLMPGLEGVMFGTTAAEGTLCLYRHMLNTANNYAQLIEDDQLTRSHLFDMIEDDSQVYFNLNFTQVNLIRSLVETLLDTDIIGTKVDSIKLRNIYLNACSAFMVKSHVNRFKKTLLARNKISEYRYDVDRKPIKVHHYELSYKPTFSLAPDYIDVAAHGDDIPLILGLVYQKPRIEINDSDLLETQKIMSYVGNFVHNNDPLLNEPMMIDLRQDSNNKIRPC